MSKIKLPFRRVNLVLVFLSLFGSIFADGERYIGDFSHSEIEQRLATLSSDIDFKLNADVKKYLDQFVVHYKHSSETLIGRSMYYYPLIESKIAEKNIPSEIKNLVIIESSLNPAARSRVGATGLWQFMRATGRMYGLKIDNVVDERRDPEKSTDAALTYLADLHERFGDWTLALAAYNCGPGNVRKAMRRSGGKDYWSIRSFLPRETRNYIPKFIAATYLMNYYTDHGIYPEYPEKFFTKTRTALIKEKTNFSEISKVTGLDIETIEWYNPEYVSKYIPKSEFGKILVLPSSEMYSLLEDKAAFDLLLPDPMQDLAEEAKEASPLLEKIAKVPSLQTMHGIDGILANFEIRNADVAHRQEITLSGSKFQKVQSRSPIQLTAKKSYEGERGQKDKRLFAFRRD